jgi:hypothetical protein
MIMKVLKVLFIVGIIIVNNYAKADSPLTSTEFYKAYLTVKEVKYASEKRKLDEKLLSFLADPSKPAAHKLAVINAISWGDTNNVILFQNYLLKTKSGLKSDVFNRLVEADVEEGEPSQVKLLTTDELMCWSYLKVMGDYFKPQNGFAASYFAINRDTTNMSSVLVYSLIIAQHYMDYRDKWCKVYTYPHAFPIERKYSTGLLNDEAIKIIFEYIDLYKEACSE